MNLTENHQFTLAAARTHVAALASRASNHKSMGAYELTLLELDALYDGIVPPVDPWVEYQPGDDIRLLAEDAIDALGDFGTDGLRLELVLAMLDEANQFDAPPDGL